MSLTVVTLYSTRLCQHTTCPRLSYLLPWPPSHSHAHTTSQVQGTCRHVQAHLRTNTPMNSVTKHQAAPDGRRLQRMGSRARDGSVKKIVARQTCHLPPFQPSRGHLRPAWRALSACWTSRINPHSHPAWTPITAAPSDILAWPVSNNTPFPYTPPASAPPRGLIVRVHHSTGLFRHG